MQKRITVATGHIVYFVHIHEAQLLYVVSADVEM